MTAKSTAGSAKTSTTRKKRSTSKTEQSVMEAVADTQPRNSEPEASIASPVAKAARKTKTTAARPTKARATKAAAAKTASEPEMNAADSTTAKTPAKAKSTTRKASKPATAGSKAGEPKSGSRRSSRGKDASATEIEAVVTAPDDASPEAPVSPEQPAKRKPGRPRKTAVAAEIAEGNVKSGNTAAPAEKPRRGRKPAAPKQEEAIAEAVTPVTDEPKPRAGRPSRRNSAPSTTPAETRSRAVKKAAEKVAAQDNAPVVSSTTVAEPEAPTPAVSEPEAQSDNRTARSRRRRGGRNQARTASADASLADTATETQGTPLASTTEAAKADPAPQAIIDAPKPLFSELGLSAPIMRAIEEMGYEHPTPIQARAIPVILGGQDVLGVAQTGTGKTASFTLPMLEKLAGSRARARMPRSLILEPTRELALQVAENLTLYGKHLRLNHALLIGGESMADQRAVLNQGVDILIATPGRLMDLFDRGGLLLTQTGILVIDEADRMLDMGFIPDITRIVSMLPVRRQTLLFSATMAPEIRTLADQFLHLPEEITVSRPSSVATTIEEALLVVDEHDKRRVLRKLLRRENVQNAIVFCNRKRDVDVLYKSLHKHGFAVGHLHGDLAQSLRFKTLERFKAGELQILVCSDVAARGIDIGGLSHVFNFDLPFNAEDYIHRIGRTGRAGKTGHAFSLASPRQKLLAEGIEKLKHAPIPMVEIEGIETLPWADPEQEGGQYERRERRGKDRGGRQNRHGENRDRDRDRAAAPEPARQASRPKQDATIERQSGEHGSGDRGSVAPTNAFDHDAPRTGFGHETPAFMLLPRRNRRVENEEQVGPIQHRGTV